MKTVLLGKLHKSLLEKVQGSLEGLFECRSADEVPVQYADMLILDLSSGQNADSFARFKANPENQNIPVIAFTDGTPAMCATAFGIGADDCIPKTAESDEIRARVRARMTSVKHLRLRLGGGRVHIDLVRQIVLYRTAKGWEQSPDLTPFEFAIFVYLLSNEGKPLLRQDILIGTWGEGVNVQPRTLDKHVSVLRVKVKAFCEVECVRTSGYVLHMKPLRLAAKQHS